MIQLDEYGKLRPHTIAWKIVIHELEILSISFLYAKTSAPSINDSNIIITDNDNDIIISDNENKSNEIKFKIKSSENKSNEISDNENKR